MAVDRRLTRLRKLVDRLERLPESTEREWMLTEARGRIVDVETGAAPRALRPIETEPPARASEPPRPDPADGGPVERPSSTPEPPPAPSAVSRLDNGDVVADDHDVDAMTLGTDGLLHLDDVSADASAEPEDGSMGSAPWRQGLRG